VGGGTEFPDLNLDDSMISAESGGAAGESSVLEHAGLVLQGENGEHPGTLSYWKERVEIKGREDMTLQRAQGTTFKPRKGRGVFWVNLHESGFGDQRVRHAGLPVREGQKVGMNIWVKRDFGW
jgi:hypothetical protein